MGFNFLNSVAMSWFFGRFFWFFSPKNKQTNNENEKKKSEK